MPGAQRRINPGVSQQLLSEPYRFQFFQAVRVLEHLFVRSGSRPQDVVPHKLKFRNTLSMSFPSSDIEKLVAYNAADEAIETRPSSQPDELTDIDEVDITPAFMGMLGTQGVLPFGYTELLASRELYQRDHAARAFLDIFSNRALALFYLSWKKYRPALQYEFHSGKHFLPLVRALSGLGLPAHESALSEGVGKVHDQALAYYAASISQRPLSAATLQDTLSEYFDVPLRIEQFVGAWYELPDSQRTRLGGKGALLGHSAITGARIWQRHLRIALWIGPLRSDQFQEFLPGGDAASALAKWLKLLGGDALEYQVHLTLHKDDIHPCQLGRHEGMRLGWDTYLCTQKSDRHRTGTSYLVHTLH